MMKERSLSEHVWAFARKHPGFSSTVLVIGANAFLFFFYTAHLGQMPPIFGLSLADTVIIFFGSMVVVLALAILAGSYVLVTLLAGQPRVASTDPCLWRWLLGLSFVEAVILAVVYLAPLILAAEVVLATLAVVGSMRRVCGAERWHILEDQVPHKLLVFCAFFVFVAWNLILTLLKGDGWTFLALAVMTLSVSFLLRVAFVSLHERRTPAVRNGQLRQKGGSLSVAAWSGGIILSLVALVGNIVGPGPWPVLGVGRYNAVCVVEKEGVDVLASEREALVARRAGEGEHMPHCQETRYSAYTCQFHVWWDVGDKWLVSKVGVPQWSFGPHRKYAILSLASRYVRGCVPI